MFRTEASEWGGMVHATFLLPAQVVDGDEGISDDVSVALRTLL